MSKAQYYTLIYILFILFSVCFPRVSYSQSNWDQQLWLDAEFNYVYKQRYQFQNEFSFQTLVSGGSRWSSINSSPGFEYNLNQHFDLVSAIPLSYTFQQNELNTFEIRAMVGFRAYLTPTRRTQLRVLVRWEDRWLNDRDNGTWNVGNRFRVRGECIYPLNKRSYSDDKVWYWLGDVELFLGTSNDVPERFANRIRLRTGIGYRLNYKLRFEAIYLRQLSRNTIDNDFDLQSNILRLRLKYYFK